MRVTVTNSLFDSELPILLLTFAVLIVPLHAQQHSDLSARSLDALLQDYAFRAFVRPRTGVPYDGRVPRNLSGIQVSAMRLRSGSLRTKGVHSYEEFQIPTGVVEQPYVKRLVLVYHNLGNWSETFYPLPGYTYVAPVLGLLAYDGSNFSATDLPELDIRSSNVPILIKFPTLKSAPNGVLFSSAKCVSFDLHGSVQFDILLDGNVCTAIQQGHFSIVVEADAPSPSPSPSPSGEIHGGGGKKKKSVLVIVVCLVVGFGVLTVSGILVWRLRRSRNGGKIKQMEGVGEGSEEINMTPVLNTRAPMAIGSRTKPMLEDDYVP